MTRTPPSDGDLAGTTERGRQAYQQRLREMQRRGIPLPPGAVIELYDFGDDDELAAADAFDAAEPSGDNGRHRRSD